MALGCAGAALAAAGCGLTSSSTKIETTTVTRTVTHTVTASPPPTTTAASNAASAPCNGSDVTATFAGVPNSEGAGNIVYKLTLTNTSSSSCFVSGLPIVQLEDAKHKTLPTSSAAQLPGSQTAVRVTIPPAGTASADARFSPDVNGVGENGNPCEPKASILQVTVGGGTVDAAIDPPTSVCSHGRLNFTVYSTS